MPHGSEGFSDGWCQRISTAAGTGGEMVLVMKVGNACLHLLLGGLRMAGDLCPGW